MGVLQAGGRLDLGKEALAADDGAQLGAQDLDRDLAGVLEVLGEVDGGHAALAELTLEAIAIGEGDREALLGRHVSNAASVSPIRSTIGQ